MGRSGGWAMMGRQRRDQGALFYEFRLEDRIPQNHLLRRMNVFVTVALDDLHKHLRSTTFASQADATKAPCEASCLVRSLVFRRPHRNPITSMNTSPRR